MSSRRLFDASLTMFLIASLLGCSSMSLTPCSHGGQLAIQEILYFGTNTPSGHVTQEEWTQFLAEVITSRFPEGLSSWQASGQWRSAAGQIIREPSYIVSLIHSGDQTADRAVQEITTVYKARFQQEAVLRVRSSTCMSL